MVLSVQLLILTDFCDTAGMTMVKLMGDLAGLLGAAVEAVAEVTVEVVAQVLRGHAAMRLPVAGPRVVAEAGLRVGAGVGAMVESTVIAAAGAVALWLAAGMKKLLLFLGLLGLTQGKHSTKALQDLTLGMNL